MELFVFDLSWLVLVAIDLFVLFSVRLPIVASNWQDDWEPFLWNVVDTWFAYTWLTRSLRSCESLYHCFHPSFVRQWFLPATPSLLQITHTYCIRAPRWRLECIDGAIYFTLYSDLKTAVRLPAPGEYWYTRIHVEQSLWNMNIASKNTVRMREYYPFVPSTYCSRHLVTW